MKQEQRLSITSHSEKSEAQSLSSELPGKRKIIKKQKTHTEQIRIYTNPSLTKEERAKIQKQKNREAAQRSRDLHKEYVTSLERQIQMLRIEVQKNKKLCYRCRQSLDFPAANFEANNLKYQHQHILKEQNELQYIIQEHISQNRSIEPKEEDIDSYLRIGNQQDYSCLKMMLFISMIVIGVFVYYPSSSIHHQRYLLEVYNNPVSNPLEETFTVQEDLQSPDQGLQVPSINHNNGLVSKNTFVNEQCLDSLFYKKFSNGALGLRSIHTNQGSEGILLCSYEQPKNPSLTYESTRSALISLFLLGTQIKQMLGSISPMHNFITNNIQLNGIYRVAAQIKEVEIMPHHNCLL